MRKRVAITERSIGDLATKADAMDIYTMQSKQKGTFYLYDAENDHVGLYFYSALLQMTTEEAKRICEEMLGFLEDIKDLKRMQLTFKGTRSRGWKDAKQRKDHSLSVLSERT